MIQFNPATRGKCPELLSDLAAQCAAVLTETLDIGADTANQTGLEIACRMAAHWGGQLVYFPKGLSYELSKRDRRIFAEFSGTNHADLAIRYGVSVQWVYKIIKMARVEEIRKGNAASSTIKSKQD